MNHLRAFGHITIAGQEYPVKFGINQTAIFCELQNCDLEKYAEIFSAEGFKNLKLASPEFINLVYSALKDGARVVKKPFDIKPEDVCDIIDFFIADPALFIDFLKIMNAGYEALLPNVEGVKEPQAEAISL